MTYIIEVGNISAVACVIDITRDDIYPMIQDKQNTLAEIIRVLAEVGKVASQLDADRRVITSRAPRLVRELYEILQGRLYACEQTQLFSRTT